MRVQDRPLDANECAWRIYDWEIVFALLWNGYSCTVQNPDPFRYELPWWHVTDFPISMHRHSKYMLDGCVFEPEGSALKLTTL